jgi:hypothetical protein
MRTNQHCSLLNSTGASGKRGRMAMGIGAAASRANLRHPSALYLPFRAQSTKDAMIFPKPKHESAMAVIAVMVLLSLILVFIAGNLGTLNHLGRDLRFVEERQKRHWSTLTPPKSAIQTNAPPSAAK